MYNSKALADLLVLELLRKQGLVLVTSVRLQKPHRYWTELCR